jgi:hypothetical protein
MKYMLMCCCDEKSWTQLPDSERDRIMREYGALIQSLVKSGQFRGGGQLRSTSSATTVRMKGGKLVLTDGPFAETKEQLGGYHLVECRDLDEASPLRHAFRRSRREVRSRCAPLSRPPRTNSR